jgi:hypothetical protein
MLLAEQPAATARALELLQVQLEEIVRLLSAPALARLRQVPLWLSPEYPGIPPKAEYHVAAAWLRAHGRDPAMAKAVEFTNVRIFDAEVRRMPVFVLHELAHAYHDQVLGHAHAGIRQAYEAAKAGGAYDRVERQDAQGRRSFGRAYALTTPQEYVAEGTEAFFGRNDFLPYDRAELRRHDPALFALLADAPPQGIRTADLIARSDVSSTWAYDTLGRLAERGAVTRVRQGLHAPVPGRNPGAEWAAVRAGDDALAGDARRYLESVA